MVKILASFVNDLNVFASPWRLLEGKREQQNFKCIFHFYAVKKDTVDVMVVFFEYAFRRKCGVKQVSLPRVDCAFYRVYHNFASMFLLGLKY